MIVVNTKKGRRKITEMNHFEKLLFVVLGFSDCNI